MSVRLGDVQILNILLDIAI